MKVLKQLRKTLFWDVDFKSIDPEKNAYYIIERILELGNDKEVKWMWKTYSKDTISNVVKRSRALRPRTKALWKTLLKNK